MKQHCLLGLLFFSLFARPLIVSARDQNCPHFSGAEKKRVESRARWLGNESLKKQIEHRSSALGHLIAFEQCHVFVSGILSGDFVAVEGPFFLDDGVPLKSLVAKYYETWSMAVAPTQAMGKMPHPNLLVVTNRKWTLIYRDESGTKTVVAVGKY